MDLFMIKQLRQLLILLTKSLNLRIDYHSQQALFDRATEYLTSC